MATATLPEVQLIERLPGGVYRQGELAIAPKPSEESLAFLYLMFKKQQILPVLFNEGTPPLRWWLDWCMKPDTAILGFFRNLESPEIVGFGCINQITCLKGNRELRKAELAEGFIKGVSPRDTLAFGKMAIAWSFEQLNLDVVLGSTPVPNRAAVYFAKKCGLREVGIARGVTLWEGEPCDAFLSYLTKEEWKSDQEGFNERAEYSA